MSDRSQSGRWAQLRLVTLADRPDLAGAMWDIGDRIWPRYMQEDPVGNLYYGRATSDFADTCLLALDGDELVARAHFIPFAWDGEDWARLPADGWDAVVRRGAADHDAGRTPTAASALEIGIVPLARRRGLSSVMLAALRTAVRRRGLEDLVAPVRPSGKHLHPDEPMDDYLARRTPAGEPADPWLRVHTRAGGRILKVAETSMRIEASLDQWQEWTGTRWDTDGPQLVDQGLVPAQVDVAADRATYVEPNVWVHHDLRSPGGS